MIANNKTEAQQLHTLKKQFFLEAIKREKCNYVKSRLETKLFVQERIDDFPRIFGKKLVGFKI